MSLNDKQTTQGLKICGAIVTADPLMKASNSTALYSDAFISFIIRFLLVKSKLQNQN